MGSTATLACHSEHGSPTPTYTWSRIGQVDTKASTDGELFVLVRSLSVCTIVSLTIHLTVSSVVNTGTLVFENITESDFGSYLCTSKNVAGESVCDLNFYAGKLFAFNHLLQMQIHLLRNREESEQVKILLSAVGATDVGKLDSNDVGYIVAIVLGIVLGCVLIGVAIYFIVQAVNKKKYKGVQQTEGTAMR